jgi:hypothetical protein
MKGTRRTLGILLIVLVLTAGFIGAAEEPPLNNADIIKLTKLAMGDQVIIAKIKTAKAVKFDTSINDLAKLKESGVSGPVITAMLERSASSAVLGTAPTKGSVAPMIALVAKEGTFDIKPISGKFKSVTVPMFGFRRFVEFPATAAATRVKDHFPTLLLNINAEPHTAIWLVKLSRWPDKVLILDLQSPSIWAGGATSDDPDETCDVPYSAIEEKSGLWRITPKVELKPGDYGLFRWGGRSTSASLLVGFGIDK